MEIKGNYVTYPIKSVFALRIYHCPCVFEYMWTLNWINSLRCLQGSMLIARCPVHHTYLIWSYNDLWKNSQHLNAFSRLGSFVLWLYFTEVGSSGSNCSWLDSLGIGSRNAQMQFKISPMCNCHWGIIIWTYQLTLECMPNDTFHSISADGLVLSRQLAIPFTNVDPLHTKNYLYFERKVTAICS